MTTKFNLKPIDIDSLDKDQLDKYINFFNTINACTDKILKSQSISENSYYLFNILLIKLLMIEEYINNLEKKYINNKPFDDLTHILKKNILSINMFIINCYICCLLSSYLINLINILNLL